MGNQDTEWLGKLVGKHSLGLSFPFFLFLEVLKCKNPEAKPHGLESRIHLLVMRGMECVNLFVPQCALHQNGLALWLSRSLRELIKAKYLERDRHIASSQ